MCGDVRRTFAEVQQRSRSLAAFLAGPGHRPAQRARTTLERWECGQDPVALVLHNGTEYVEAMLGAYRARAVPFNVNQHYRPAEIGALVDEVGCPGGRLPPALRPAAGRGRATWPISCSSTSTTAPASSRCPAARPSRTRSRTPVADAARAVARRPLPGVHRRHDRAAEGRAVASGRHLRVRHGRGRGRHRRVDRRRPPRSTPGGPGTPVPPLMHAAAQWTAFCGLHGGATVAAPRRLAALRCRRRPRDRRARAGLHDVDRRRRLRPAAGRGAPAAHLRPLVARPARHRRRGDQRAPEGRAARARPAPHDHRRVRRVGDRRHGLRRPQPQDQGRKASSPRPGPRWSPTTARASSSRATRRSAGPPDEGASRSATWTTGKAPRPPSRSSTASACRSPATGPSCLAGRQHPAARAATRWW